MLKRTVSGIMFLMLLIGMLTLVFNVQPVEAEPTTIIVPDDYTTIQEAIDVASAGDIILVRPGTYKECVLVNKENLTVTSTDGPGSTIVEVAYHYGTVFNITANHVSISGFTVTGCGCSGFYGIYLNGVSNTNVSNNIVIENYYYGIGIVESGYNLVSNNDVISNYFYGILLERGDHNTIVNNDAISSHYAGICVWTGSYNMIANNNVSSNDDTGILAWGNYDEIVNNNIRSNSRGISLGQYCKIYHNNFIDNEVQAEAGVENAWDDGYPSGGNYWSDYNVTDFYGGPYQNETGSDGIGDTPYVIAENNQDNYPLMNPWGFEPYVPSTQYPWSMFRHNLRHTGYTESPAPNTNQTQWTYTTGNDVDSSPAVADGMLFVGSYDGNVYALDQHTGAHIWNYTTGGSVGSSPAVADGKVYVGSYDHKVYCLDAATGEHIWNYTTGAWMGSSPAVADGMVFVGSFDKKVYALNETTGVFIWSYTTGGSVYSSPAVADGKVYVGSYDHKVYCLDAATGEHIWNYTTGGIVYSSPAVADGKIFVGSEDNKVYCLDAATGEHIWSYTTGGNVGSSPAVADGKVFVGSTDFKVYCLDAATGEHIWNYTTGAWMGSSPAVADGKIFVGSEDNKVYCLDAATGAHIWSYTTGGDVRSSPAVADGMLFVGSNDNNVYAFGNVIRVPEDYPTIQEAIDAAESGATIIVAPGVYHESMVINKTLTLIGEKGSGPIHEGGGSGIGWNITDTSEVTIINFVITNWDQGMLIENSSNCKIYGNIFQENNVAINLTESSIINTIYWNNFIDNSVQVITETSMNIWDNDYPDGGNYWSTHISEDQCSGPNQNEPGSDGIFDTNYTIVGNNIDRYPLVKPFSPHDIGITNITTSKTVVGQGYNMNITVKILNYGINIETFTITVYAHTTAITQTQITLKSRKSTTITLTWNTTSFAYGNYTIKAVVQTVSGETDTSDNTKVGGWIIVTIAGDIDGSGKADLADLFLFGKAWMSKPGDPNWNPNADLDGSDKVDLTDLFIFGKNWMKTL